jgi:SAM-dependent methyltransferase
MTMKDTDSDWKEIAETEPFFGVLTQPMFLRENLDDEALSTFYASGRDDIAWQIDLLRKQFGETTIARALDFGCGVGRLTCAMAEIAQTVYGLDVAPAMLELARQRAPANAVFVDELPDVAFDWINSLIVFQHIPPERGVQILQQLLDRLNVGGLISLHFTIARDSGLADIQSSGTDVLRWDGNHFETLVARPPSVGGMMMYDYNLNQIMVMIQRAGIPRATLQHTDHGGHHGVVILGQKVR